LRTSTALAGARFRGHGPARLDLYRDQPGARVDEDVDLVPGGVAPEVELRILPPCRVGLDEFGDDERLEDGAAQRMSLERRRIFDAQQVAHQSGVEKVKPRTLAEALAEVRVMRWQSGRDVPDLKRRVKSMM